MCTLERTIDKCPNCQCLECVHTNTNGTMGKCPDYQGVLISEVSCYERSKHVYTNTNK